MDVIKNLLIDVLGRRTDNFDWRIYQEPVRLDDFDRICLLHLNDKLGDGLMFSLLVDALKEERPEVEIHIGATAGFLDYWSRHPRVATVSELPVSLRRGRGTWPRVWASIRAARPLRGRYDAVVSFESYARADHFALLRTLGPRLIVGFNKAPYRLFDYSFDEERHSLNGRHVAARVVSATRAFGFEAPLSPRAAHVPYGAEEESRVTAVLSPVDGTHRLLLHTYGHGVEKRLSPESAARLVGEVRREGYAGTVFVGVPQGQEEIYERCLSQRESGPFRVVPPLPTMFELFAFVDRMDAVVSLDTSVGHIAAAFGKPQVCLFARRGNIHHVWRPLNDRCHVLLSTTGEAANDVDWSALRPALGSMLRDAESLVA